MSFGPGLGSDFVNLMVGHPRQAGKDIFEITVGVDLAAAAAFDDGVDDGSACTFYSFLVVLATKDRTAAVMTSIICDSA